MDVRESPAIPIPPETLVMPPMPPHSIENPPSTGVAAAVSHVSSVLPSPPLPIPLDRFEQLSIGPERSDVSPRGSPRGQPPKFYPDRDQQCPPGEDVSPPELLTDEDISIRDAASMGHPLASPPPMTPPPMTPPPPQQPVSTPMTVLPQPPAVKEMDEYAMPPVDMGYEQPLPAAYMFKRLGEKLAGVIMVVCAFLGDKCDKGSEDDYVIMRCTDETKKECLEGLVFGLPARHWEYLQHVNAGATFYLFNYSTRALHGIFHSVEPAAWKLNRHGWSPAPHVETPFPAQIRVERAEVYPPLLENEYRPILDSKKNYIMNTQKFSFELDAEQVQQLDALFVSTKTLDPDRQEPPPIVKMYRPRRDNLYWSPPPRYGPRRGRGHWGYPGMGYGWRPRHPPFRGGYSGRSPGRGSSRGRRPPMGTTHPLALPSTGGRAPESPAVPPPPGMGMTEPPAILGPAPPGMGTPPPGMGTPPPGMDAESGVADRLNRRSASEMRLPVQSASTPLPDRSSTSHLPPPVTAPPTGLTGV